MQYPLISEYVRAIQDASNNLDELGHLEPVLDDHGEPYRSSGAFAVVFKMKDEQTGKCYALKCFTEEQEGRAEAYRQIADELEFVDSSYITSVKYLDKEIFVDSNCEEDEFPVLLMDWIDGETMESYIAENYQDNYVMAMLCYRFCKMAAWLRFQPFAHGDIKPDNIMVRPDGSLTLVDYDGMFVPAMKGQKSPTIGTKDFSHPLRTVDDFDETIDDFALASIALSLKAISLKSSLLDEYGAADRLLFSAEDYRDLSKSKVLAALQELMNVEEVNTLLSMFLLVCVKKNLSLSSFHAFFISKPFNVVEDLIKQADMLFEKSKVEADHKKAFHLYSIANSKGSLYAKACLGYCYCLGKGVTEDKEKGLALIRVSANAGNAKGQNIMGLCYVNGISVTKSYEEAVIWFRKSADQGNAIAQKNLGICYYIGQGVPQSYKEAVKYSRKPADQGNTAAQYILGVCYAKGQGVPQSYDEAVKWYRKSADQGNAAAQCNLGVCYENGQGVPQSYDEAVKWYRKSADQGNAAAQYNLGVCYAKGQGVPQSYDEAVKWYRKSADQGNAAAQCNLGVCYENGQGVPQSYDEAVKWYRKSADQGNAAAQCNLGVCYKKGNGCKQSFRVAIGLFQKSSKQGNSCALYNLGTCFEEGTGVEQNLAKAIEYYNEAANKGHKTAKEKLVKLKQQ